MKSVVLTVLLGIVALACTGGTADPSTTTVVPGTTTTSAVASSTSTSEMATTTTTVAVSFPAFEFPDGPCQLDGPLTQGEVTVLIGTTFYTLGPDNSAPRCLLEEVTSTDVRWNPTGTALIAGKTAVGDDFEYSYPLATDLSWTFPTGSSVVVFTTDQLWKVAVDDGTQTDITFLAVTDAVAYHPAGEHLLAVGTDLSGQYGLWLATNQGTDPLLLAFDEGATLSDPAWTWLGEPVFVAAHDDGVSHIHRVELTSEGGFDGPIIVESDAPLDMLIPSPFDPIMLAYRTGGMSGESCVDGSHVAVSNVDVPEPLNSWTTSPVGWLPEERLLVLAYPDGCDSPADLWSFSPGLCPGSVYGAFPVIAGVSGAAARAPVPVPPPPPDFAGVIDPAPA
ncbi:MAG TPA: hypothetical protein VIW94_04210 [Acidimicrobiia bacterium]